LITEKERGFSILNKKENQSIQKKTKLQSAARLSTTETQPIYKM